MTEDNTRVILARLLAKYYGVGKSVPSACACSGLDGVCIYCSSWWEMFLKKYDGDDIERMLDILIAVRRLK